MLLNKMRLVLDNVNFKRDTKHCIVTGIKPLKKYGTEPPEIIGSIVDCLGHGNMTWAVKVIHDASEPLCITKEMIENSSTVGVAVIFENLEISAYCFIEKETGKLKQGINASASGIKLVNPDTDDEIVF